jgi:hypothetical protein
MKFVVIAAVVLSSVSLAGCFETASLGSLSRAPNSPKHSTPDIQDCIHVPFPQCGGGS